MTKEAEEDEEEKRRAKRRKALAAKVAAKEKQQKEHLQSLLPPYLLALFSSPDTLDPDDMTPEIKSVCSSLKSPGGPILKFSELFAPRPFDMPLRVRKVRLSKPPPLIDEAHLEFDQEEIFTTPSLDFDDIPPEDEELGNEELLEAPVPTTPTFMDKPEVKEVKEVKEKEIKLSKSSSGVAIPWGLPLKVVCWAIW